MRVHAYQLELPRETWPVPGGGTAGKASGKTSSAGLRGAEFCFDNATGERRLTRTKTRGCIGALSSLSEGRFLVISARSTPFAPSASRRERLPGVQPYR